jgi:hypothetical protein
MMKPYLCAECKNIVGRFILLRAQVRYCSTCENQLKAILPTEPKDADH